MSPHTSFLQPPVSGMCIRRDHKAVPTPKFIKLLLTRFMGAGYVFRTFQIFGCNLTWNLDAFNTN